MGKKTTAKLEVGDVVCPKCKGTGKSKAWSVGEFKVEPECPKCLGDGKFDWIDKIMGKVRKPYYQAIDAWVDELSKELANEIDKEILEKFIGSFKVEEEQNIKEKEDKHDNGVLSELLFHPIIKQKIKGKKD